MRFCEKVEKTSTFALANPRRSSYIPAYRALVAQLDRVLDYESRGRGFESSPERHFPFQRKNRCRYCLRVCFVDTL